MKSEIRRSKSERNPNAEIRIGRFLGVRDLASVAVLGARLVLLCFSLLVTSASAQLTNAVDRAEMVLVPAGEFIIGSLDGKPDEAPPRRVTLAAFYIDRYEVTHEQYAGFLAATKHPAPVDWPNGQMPSKLAKHPVVNVTYSDAEAYANWAGKRLPTEAEWEKAARGTDGRVFPWGDSSTVKSAAGEAGKERTWPVGSFTNDVSAYGAVDMGGNVWEWTSSWYDRYPGSDAVELEFGQKYKVIRGGGAIEYYGEPSTRRCAQRGRSVPYGTFDGLGFRCVKPVATEPEVATRDSGTADVPAAQARKATRNPEARPRSVVLTVTEPIGVARRAAPITSGIPFPIGLVQTNDRLQLRDGRGKEVGLQSTVSATWRDGSVKWVLLDFQADLNATESRQFTLSWGGSNSIRSASGIMTDSAQNAVQVRTGPVQLRFPKAATTNSTRPWVAPVIDHDVDQNGQFTGTELGVASLEFWMTLARTSAVWNGASTLSPLEADETVVEESGPLRTVIRQSGWFGTTTAGNTPPFMRYLLRAHAYAGSSKLKLQFTAVNLGRTNKMVWVESYGIRLKQAENRRGPGEAQFGTDGGVRVAQIKQPGEIASLKQSGESVYTLRGPSLTNAGIRANGWASWSGAQHGFTVGVRDFWQQFPNALQVSAKGIAIELFHQGGASGGTNGEPFDWDQGLAKTHEVWIDLGNPGHDPSSRVLLTNPESDLFATAPIDWYCDSKVFGEVAPFNFDLFPDYETLTEASGDKFIKSMATGIRNWGDVYYGGPYKGKNSYMNLEYDVPHNFLIQFARTGQRKYLDAARRMAQHQADIDINHFTKWQWKHSPRHTEIQAEFGHTFTRGLIENYYLTGNRRTLEGAITLGDFFTKQIRNPRETGNERQIGWGLISLLPVFEATWDNKYLEAARETVDRLVAGQDARGKFNIRWDNRISFFNGIAATGFIYYERATGDKRAAEAALRTIRRTKGFYPEYAGRTLEALAWAYDYTGDPEYLDLLKLTYETTMARQIALNTMELGAPTIFTVHTLPFIEQAGLVTRPKQPLSLTAAAFASDNGLHAHHVPSGSGDVYLKVNAGEPFDLALVRKGAWKADATAEVFDPSGVSLQRWNLPSAPTVWQRETMSIRAQHSGTYRVALRSAHIENTRAGSYVTWDVATSRPIPAVLQVPEFRGLQFVTPYLYTVPLGGTDKIELELVGEGEGFKKAVVYDPAGNVAGTMEAFIDLGDMGRYTYKLAATIKPEHRNGIWRVSLQDVALARLSGLAPYFATSPQAFFRPDRAAPDSGR